MNIRPARAADAEQVAAIYNHGIDERQATFETRARRPAEIEGWLEEGRPFLVATEDDHTTVLGFARVSPYSVRQAYAGVAEHAVYVAPDARGRGVGVQLLNALATASEQAGYYKLTSRVFTTNTASLALHRKAGFTEVGIQRRHGRLDGDWKDTMLVERLLGDAARQ
ncbi:arsinothricin resistance N-acetyltransferase ArsN1 [Solirubrobacter phytolaccae]|uniref:Arsinothricin resistance N-acetyltransferase ArsN1 n=1 Tax=Solirubrobacter phytolaccae TaxID=1404360 RepID=A0A9X3N7Z7_9ACTN|nr:arsinothricin resistance N-acetyltransferase ArsN1 family A [Solirubrobacter phytolaccae]MDA0181433.1 arsinothricin resistance N-acetyltransferase ArsN1 [Solirubrobacter phytolaccae]